MSTQSPPNTQSPRPRPPSAVRVRIRVCVRDRVRVCVRRIHKARLKNLYREMFKKKKMAFVLMEFCSDGPFPILRLYSLLQLETSH